MNPVLISPEGDDPREVATLRALFAAGLDRYHVRKPGWSREKLAAWLRALPAAWLPRLVTHQHHDLAAECGLAGRHWRDDAQAPASPPPGGFSSRSCHDPATLRAALGRYDSIFFSPVFPSISKPGHGPAFAPEILGECLAARAPAERRTTVLALGGITVETAPRALALGFDGVAVLGAIWRAVDPVAAFVELRDALSRHAA